MPSKLRCLIADDTALSRKLVRTALELIADIEIVDTARDGLDAVEKCKALNDIDFVTMDLEMPRMDGIEAVRALKSICPNTRVVMVSSLTSTGARVTNDALRAGAFDFVLKPVTNSFEDSVVQLREQLFQIVEAARSATPKRLINTLPAHATPPTTASRSRNSRRSSFTAVCIGVSTGGPNALAQILPQLPAEFPIPIFVVQHMPPMFTNSLACQLNEASRIRVVEAADGMHAEPGCCYIAPGGKHMSLRYSLNRMHIQTNDGLPECNAKPSVDHLFRSAAGELQSGVLAFVLTGMGDDGLNGCRAIKSQGGMVITQNEQSCVVYGMPKRVFDAGLSDTVLGLNEIAAEMKTLVGTLGVLCH